MSYMEMFGKSVLPSGEDLLQVLKAPLSEYFDELSQGLFHPHDLLHNVWQQNFHEYSEYAPTSLLNFPLADHHLGELGQDGDDGDGYSDTTRNKKATNKHI